MNLSAGLLRFILYTPQVTYLYKLTSWCDKLNERWYHLTTDILLVKMLTKTKTTINHKEFEFICWSFYIYFIDTMSNLFVQFGIFLSGNEWEITQFISSILLVKVLIHVQEQKALQKRYWLYAKSSLGHRQNSCELHM